MRVLPFDGSGDDSWQRMQELLNRWGTYYQIHPDEDRVTPDRLSALSQGIKGIDPKIHDAWRKDISTHYPNVDRSLGWDVTNSHTIERSNTGFQRSQKELCMSQQHNMAGVNRDPFLDCKQVLAQPHRIIYNCFAHVIRPNMDLSLVQTRRCTKGICKCQSLSNS